MQRQQGAEVARRGGCEVRRWRGAEVTRRGGGSTSQGTVNSRHSALASLEYPAGPILYF